MMKGAFIAGIAVFALAGVNAKEEGKVDDQNDISRDLDLSKLFDGEAGDFDWSKFSPQALGMNLDFGSMSSEELHKVAQAFKELGLIQKEEIEDLVSTLQHPSMRRLMKDISQNWPGAVHNVLADPRYKEFVKSIKNPAALAEAVGLKGDLEAISSKSEDN